MLFFGGGLGPVTQPVLSLFGAVAVHCLVNTKVGKNLSN